ncbi:MAG TPA: DUF2848 family protein [Planctomycetota bacterium]|nr:DUF2848 family protein [Planctomycetota bacterium]
MMRALDLELEDRNGATRPLKITATSMINLGYVGRDEAAVRHHIEELAREGVPPPASIPMKIPMPLSALSLEEQIDVASEKTSGEVEAVFLFQGKKTYVGIGSDHTDRALERSDMALSKQVCPNVLGRRVWDFDEIKNVWEKLELRSWVRDECDTETLYQHAPLSSMLPAQRLIDCALSALKDPAAHEGLVMYTGTVGLLHKQFVYARGFRCELFNPTNDRRLGCAYKVRTLSSIFS